MQKSVFVDDNIMLGECYVKREYGNLKEKIIGGGYHATDALIDEGELFGFHITKNHNVSQIYGMDCYVVRFIFSGVSQIHDNRQERILCELLNKLKNYIDSHKG